MSINKNHIYIFKLFNAGVLILNFGFIYECLKSDNKLKHKWTQSITFHQYLNELYVTNLPLNKIYIISDTFLFWINCSNNGIIYFYFYSWMSCSNYDIYCFYYKWFISVTKWFIFT